MLNMAVQRIKVQSGGTPLSLKRNKVGVTAALMSEGMKKFGITASRLDRQRSSVAAQMIANTALFAKKYGIKVNAGMVNSVGTGTEGLADHVARTITLLGPIIQYNTTGFDHVVVFPMKTRNCTFVYPELYYATNKGGYKQGDLIRSPFKTTPQTATYPTKHIGDPTKTLGVSANPETYVIATGDDEVSFVLQTPNAIQNTIRVGVGTAIAYHNGTAWINPSAFTVTQTGDEITVTLVADATADTPVFVSYNYDNEKLPRGMVPTLGARLGHIPMSAEFIQVQIICDAYADFEARNDFGYKLVDALIEQAPLEVSYTISRLIYNGLYELAEKNTTAAEYEETIVDFRAPNSTYLFENIVKQNLGTLISTVDNVIRRRTGRYGLTNLTFGAQATRILNAVFADDRSDGARSGAYKLGTFAKTGIYIDDLLPVTKLVQAANGAVSEISLDTVTPAGSTRVGFKIPFFGDCKSGNIAAAVYGEYMSIVPTDEMFVPSFEKWKGFATAGAFAELNGMLAVAGAIIIPA
jgi:hypothetical protein